jgi:hypothetical protein
MNLFSAYLATFLVVFSAVGVMLYISAYYLHDELAKNLADVCSSETKNSVLFKPV